MVGGFSRALSGNLPVRYARPLFSRSDCDPRRRTFAGKIPQLRRKLHGLPDRPRGTPGGGGNAGAQAPEVPEARAGLGAEGAAGAPDKVGGSSGALLRNGRSGGAG